MHLILAADQTEKVAELILGSDTFEGSEILFRRVAMFLLALFILPWLFARSLKFLGMLGAVTSLTVVYIIIAVTFLYKSQKLQVRLQPSFQRLKFMFPNCKT